MRDTPTLCSIRDPKTPWKSEQVTITPAEDQTRGLSTSICMGQVSLLAVLPLALKSPPTPLPQNRKHSREVDLLRLSGSQLEWST